MGIRDKFKDFFELPGDDTAESDISRQSHPTNDGANDGASATRESSQGDHSVQELKRVVPYAYSDVQYIADHLQDYRFVAVDVQKISKADTVRMVDFLGGVTYVSGGFIEKLAPQMFVCSLTDEDTEDDILHIQAKLGL